MHMLNLAGWLETARSESKIGNLRDPTVQVEPNLIKENITLTRSGRESVRIIVVMKRGNACGAKGPYHKQALNKKTGSRLSYDYSGKEA